MKKSLVALAALAVVGAASAQSSVTLFGVVDANVGSYRNGDASVTKMNTSGLSSSRLGFRGVEDLGGGMSAAFHLEAGINPDSGLGQGTNTNNQVAGATTAGGLTFNRRSTLSLMGNFGEVRLGRDYTPGFRALTEFDPFGTLGVGQASNLSLNGTGVNAVRASNSITYLFNDGGFGPIAPGVYGQVQLRMGENSKDTPAVAAVAHTALTPAVAAQAATAKSDGNGMGLRVGYMQGPLNISAAIDSSKGLAQNTKYTQNNIAASYDLGVAKLMAIYGVNNSGVANTRSKTLTVGAQIPMGQGHIPVSYNVINTNTLTNAKAAQFAIGYVHNLSKRSALYTTFSTLSNKNGAAFGVSGGLGGVANKTSSGIEFGVKHSF